MSNSWDTMGFDDQAFEGFAAADSSAEFASFFASLGEKDADMQVLGNGMKWAWQGLRAKRYARLVEIFSEQGGDFVQMRVQANQWLWMMSRAGEGVISGLSDGVVSVAKKADIHERWREMAEKGA